MSQSHSRIRSPPLPKQSGMAKGGVMNNYFFVLKCVSRVGTLIFTIIYGEIMTEGGNSSDD